jgi:formylglycine-generating enzyme required for sulfatase activity
MFFRHVNPVLATVILAVTATLLAPAWPFDLTARHTAALAEAKATGSLTVKIKPPAAKQAGARWRVDGGNWKKSGRNVSGLSTGEHMVTFKKIAGWETPSPRLAKIYANQETSISEKYVQTNELVLTLPGNVPLEMVWIPAGSFMMGRYTNEADSYSDEDPQHQVTFASGFWMGKYEVTQAQWMAVMGSNPSYFTGDLNRPVEQVSWDTVQTFIAAVNALGQGTVHLPSEAQWEYACRVGTTTRFYWGDDPSSMSIGSYAWYIGNSSSTTHPVGQKLPNAWGLYDMAGNVYEWCEDYWHSNYTGAPTDGSAWLSPTASDRAVRGGSWYLNDYLCRSAKRGYYAPASPAFFTGFRLAR